MAKKEKKSVVGLRPTTSYSPLRGQNQDYGGVGVKNDNADYTISDEHIHNLNQPAHAPEWERETPATRKALAAKLERDTDPNRGKKMKKSLREVAEGRTLAEIKEMLSLVNEAEEKETVKHPVGKRPKGVGWVLKQAGEQTGKDHSVWTRKVKRIDKVNEDDMVKNLKPINLTGGSEARTNKLASMAAGKEATPAPVDKKKEAGNFLKVDEAAAAVAGANNKRATEAANSKKKDDEKREEANEGYIQEARGRPKKDAASDSPDTHPIQQARQVISTRGMHPFTFANGKRAQMNPMTAHRILAHHDNLQTPAEKEAFASRVHKDVDSLHSWLAGKPHDEELPKISLGGSSKVGGIADRSRPTISGVKPGKKK